MKTLFVPFLALLLIVALSNVTYAVEMALQDTPGNWFMSEDNEILPALDGTPLAIIDPGDEVEFEISREYTGTMHTVTVLIKPDGSAMTLFDDTEETDMATPATEVEREITFDEPGVYLWHLQGPSLHDVRSGSAQS